MATNARIERLTREALGASAVPVPFPKGTLKALAVVAIGLATVGAIAGTLAAQSRPAETAHRFVGVAPVADRDAKSEGNVHDLTY